jgi:hypothetical protein
MTKQEWTTKAFHALVRYAKRASKPFTIEQARSAIAKRLDEPLDLRWWGGVTQAAKREGAIRSAGFTAPAKSSHHSQKPVWVRGV